MNKDGFLHNFHNCELLHPIVIDIMKENTVLNYAHKLFQITQRYCIKAIL